MRDTLGRQDGQRHGGANNCLTTPCLTIQHAVDEVAAGPCPGDMVNVDMGTYAEQVTIGISLTLTLTAQSALTLSH